MFKLLLLMAFVQGYASELEVLPVNEGGRFRPLEVYSQLTGSSPELQPDLKMLPTKGEWLPLNSLKKERNLTLFSTQQWLSLKEAYQLWENDHKYAPLFAEKYLQAYRNLKGFPSIAQLKIEQLYFKWPLTSYAIVCYLAALLLFLLGEGFASSLLKKWGWGVLGLAFLFHSLLLALRIFILMRPPVSSMGETVIYVPWIGTVLGTYLSYRLRTVLPAITAAGMAACLLAILQWTFTPYRLENVQAVLNSQLWLTVHVLMIVASYGALILGGIIGHILLIFMYLNRPTARLEQALIQSLYVGIALLIPGTILGGVWAAQSWGRFWDWDPKESWAFISACVYLLVVHAYRFRRIGAKGLAIGSIAGLLAISFTWYGVNYILGTGLHSYGFGSGGEWIYFSYIILECTFIGACIRTVQYLNN